MKVYEVMRRDVPMVHPLHTIYYVLSPISRSDMGKVIVMDNNRPKGVITEKDVAFSLEELSVRGRESKYRKRTRYFT